MNSLQDFGAWGSDLLGQAQAQLAPAAAAAIKKGTQSLTGSATAPGFVGSTYSFQDPRRGRTRRVTETAFLAEGAFGAVVKVSEAGTGQEFAVKKINCREGVQVASTLEAAEMEAKILTSIAAHPNLIACHGYSIDHRGSGSGTVKLLLELCTGGHLLDFMDQRGGNLSAREVLESFAQVTEAVRHLHAQSPPIQHRDLKVENVLRGSDGRWKLCDFGSCSTERVPAEQLSRSRLLRLQEEIDKTVTMLYRPPEMADIELNFRKGYVIDEKVDIWMLGCILFTLAFYRHPFQDNPTAMAITNGKYFVPSDHELAKSAKLCGFIHWLLAADPRDRPSAPRMLEILGGLGKSTYDDLKRLMPAKVLEKIRKLDVYAARKDIGDVPLPDCAASALAAAGSLAKGAGLRASAARRPSSPRSSAKAASADAFDINFALAPGASPSAAQRAQAPVRSSGAACAKRAAADPLPRAVLVADLLSFTDAAPRSAPAAPAVRPPPSDFCDLLDFAETSTQALTTPPASDWSADFSALSPPASVTGSSPRQSPRAPDELGIFAGAASMKPMCPWPSTGGSAFTAGQNVGVGGCDFAGFLSMPPPKATAAIAAGGAQFPSPPSGGGQLSSVGNLLDF